MAIVQIQRPSDGPLNNGMTFFALGFRPFFLFAGIGAVLLLALWLLVYHGTLAAPGYYGGVAWHGHEMLFGYAVAVVAGFLLTAVRNWTGIQTPRYRPLAGLTLLWLLGRVVPFVPMVPGWLVAAIDFSLLPLLALGIAVPLFKSRQPSNIPFVFILLALAVANGLFHAELLGWAEGTLQAGIRLAVGLLVLLIAVMGGRVIPFFIERGLPGVRNRNWPWLEIPAIVSALLFVLADLFVPGSGVAVVVSFAAAAIHLLRVAGWYHHRMWGVSLLWVLFVGYLWVGIGLLLHALAGLGLVNPMLALHAFAVGAVGILTLGMMARVAIGHTGRMMQAHPLMGWSFALVTLAALVRVVVPMFFPALYLRWIDVAGLLWLLAFVAFVVIYFPILTKPRVDGQEG